MTFDEVYELIPGNGWLTEEEARLLWDVAGSCEGPILEIGCYQGRSTVLLASLGRTVHAVDPFSGFDSDDPTGEKTYQKFMQNVYYERCLMNVYLWRQRVEDWGTWPVGFAYLDGDHTYQGTLDQIDKAVQAGARVLCVHDYGTTGGGAVVAESVRVRELTVVTVVGRMAHCRLGAKA